jgi:hypothetical protein
MIFEMPHKGLTAKPKISSIVAGMRRRRGNVLRPSTPLRVTDGEELRVT